MGGWGDYTSWGGHMDGYRWINDDHIYLSIWIWLLLE